MRQPSASPPRLSLLAATLPLGFCSVAATPPLFSMRALKATWRDGYSKVWAWILLALSSRTSPWLLLTSAYHMPRAVGVFRKAGFAAEAYPVDWRTRGGDDLWRPFATLGDGLRRTDTAVREWVGLFVYWLSDRSSALFPGP